MPRNEINVDVSKMGEIFEYNLKYVVPLYQRDYAWKIEQSEEFWKDLTHHYETKTKSYYFFGTIMLVNESEKDEKYTVIDGQQRLTTSLILLIAFRDYFFEQGLLDEVDELNQVIYTEENNEPRLELNVYNKNFFASDILEQKKITAKITALKSDKQIRKKNKQLRDCYIDLGEKIKCFSKDPQDPNKDLIKLYQHFLRYFTVVENIIIDLARAYKIFETINHKGLHLNPNDLVKNHLMQVIHTNNTGPSKDIHEEIIKADNSWQTIRRILEQIGITEDKYLRYYLMAFIGQTPKEQIYDMIKKTYSDKEKVQKFLETFETRVLTLSTIKKPKLIDWNNDQDVVDDLLALDNLSDGGLYPIILLAKERFDDNNMKRLIHLCTKLFFRIKTVCSVNYSEMEKLVDSICKMIRDNLETSIEDIKNMMINWNKYPDNDVFKVNFEKLELTQASKAKYVLTELHYAMIGGKQTASTVISEKCELEHIMPQKISDSEWEQYIQNEKNKTTSADITEYHQDNVNKLGNMTLLNKSRNRSISNNSFNTKKGNYQNDELKITKDITNYPIWNDETITSRQKDFYNFAKDIWDLKSI